METLIIIADSKPLHLLILGPPCIMRVWGKAKKLWCLAVHPTLAFSGPGYGTELPTWGLNAV